MKLETQVKVIILLVLDTKQDGNPKKMIMLLLVIILKELVVEINLFLLELARVIQYKEMVL